MTLLLLQMAAVVMMALVCGWIAGKLGQARVIGEMVGGILLGPSVLGRLSPQVSASLFPQSSFGSLEVLSTVGLILFLFLIGSELEYELLLRQRWAAAAGSAMSMLLPFTMAGLAAPFLLRRFAPVGVPRGAFTLFLGISISITAFPVLARILEERKMQGTALGTTALLCAAVDDVCAWSLLAVALTLLPASHGAMGLGQRLLGLAVYLLVMLGAMLPLGRWVARRRSEQPLSYELLGVMVAMVLVSAAATEALGVHPLFGAFLAGVCFPRVPRWQSSMRASLDTIVSVLLLPLFFALTGMRTRLDLLSGGRVWTWVGVVLCLAVAGKIGGGVLAARWTGQTWKDAWALGALLNTRGLVELIVLHIAYDAHVFSPVLYTMLVVMALVTTAMTTPMLHVLGVGRTRDVRELASVS